MKFKKARMHCFWLAGRGSHVQRTEWLLGAKSQLPARNEAFGPARRGAELGVALPQRLQVDRGRLMPGFQPCETLGGEPGTRG